MLVAIDPLLCCKSLSFTRLLAAASKSTTSLCILSCTFAQVVAAQFSFHSARVVRQLATCIIWAALNGTKLANRHIFHSIFFEKLTFVKAKGNFKMAENTNILSVFQKSPCRNMLRLCHKIGYNDFSPHPLQPTTIIRHPTLNFIFG